MEVPILEDDNVGTMHEKLSEAGAKLLSETLPKLLKGELSPIESKMMKRRHLLQTLKENKKKSIGHKQEKTFTTIFVDLNPWPVAYTTMDGDCIKNLASSKNTINTIKQHQEPFVEIENDGFIIATGNETAIKIMELQPSGKKRMSCGTIFKRGRISFNKRYSIRG